MWDDRAVARESPMRDDRAVARESPMRDDRARWLGAGDFLNGARRGRRSGAATLRATRAQAQFQDRGIFAAPHGLVVALAHANLVEAH